MRQKREVVLAFAGQDDELPKTVRQYHEKYKGIRAALDQVPTVLVRTRKKAVMDHTFLNRCFKAIQPSTWKRVNELLAAHCVQEGCIDPSVIRTDTTVVECNVHYPTESWSAIPDAPGEHAIVSARSEHGSGVNVALGDGSVKFVSETSDLRVWRAVGTRNGGEVDVLP